MKKICSFASSWLAQSSLAPVHKAWGPDPWPVTSSHLQLILDATLESQSLVFGFFAILPYIHSYRDFFGCSRH